jgi:hypothetical protein
MRNINVTLMAIAIAVALFLTGCQNDMIDSEDNFGTLNGSTIVSNNLPSELVDNLNFGGLDNPFNEEYQDKTLDNIFSETRGSATDTRRESVKNDRTKRDDRGERVGDDMGLTDEQKRAVAQARAAYLRCSESSRLKIAEIHRAIFGAANDERQSIIEKVRSGELSREAANRMMEALRMKLMRELESNTELKRANANLRACQEQLAKTMREILSKDQRDKIDDRKRDNDNTKTGDRNTDGDKKDDGSGRGNNSGNGRG